MLHVVSPCRDRFYWEAASVTNGQVLGVGLKERSAALGIDTRYKRELLWEF